MNKAKSRVNEFVLIYMGYMTVPRQCHVPVLRYWRKHAFFSDSLPATRTLPKHYV